MNKINVFCFGFGQVAKNFISKLNLEKIKINLSVTSREKTKEKKFDQTNYKSFYFENESFDPELVTKLKESKYILISVPPVNENDLVFKNFSKVIEECNPKWITYLSATSVYGDHKGKWVNEESKTSPTSINGLSRLKAEKSWISLCSKKKLPIQIFRLSGIYSDQNNIFKRLKSGNASIINKKNHLFSRIHVEDIGNILFKSLSNFQSGEIYNISDDKPTSSEEVTLYAVKMLNIQMPKIIEIKDIQSEMLRNFYKDSKKVDNKKMKEFFNHKLNYKTYVDGFNYIFNNTF